MTIAIAPLSHETLAASQDLAFSVFKRDLARRALAATLDPSIADQYEDMRSYSNRRAWVALDDTGTVAGIVGLYTTKNDESEADWVNWFCVAPRARGHGAGRQLLKQAIEGAKANNKKILRLWTTNGPVETEAQFLYETMGFAVYKTEPSENLHDADYEGDTIIY